MVFSTVVGSVVRTALFLLANFYDAVMTMFYNRFANFCYFHNEIGAWGEAPFSVGPRMRSGQKVEKKKEDRFLGLPRL